MISCVSEWRNRLFMDYLPVDQRALRHTPVAQYTRLVGRVKLGVGVAVVVLVLLLVIWPLIRGKQEKFSITFDNIEVGTAEEPTMVKPRFHGVDDNNQPYNITADQAVKRDGDHVFLTNLHSDITLKDGAWLSLLSNEGELDLKREDVQLRGEVNLFSDSGYEFFTQTASVDFKKGIAQGNSAVTVQGPSGVLKARAFRLEDKGNKVHFTGGVNVKAYLE